MPQGGGVNRSAPTEGSGKPRPKDPALFHLQPYPKGDRSQESCKQIEEDLFFTLEGLALRERLISGEIQEKS